MSLATLGYGSVFEIANENSPNDYTALAEIFSIKPPSSKLDQIDVTHMQSPNRRREFISGLNDSGECSFDMNFIPNSASDQRLVQLLNIPTGQTRSRGLRISYPNGTTWSFNGELVGYEPTIPVDDKMTATVTFKVSGDIIIGIT